ncbi:uncharacterized protein [Cherax quadricarinatus]|uniref:uncharacterized protein n=1 Tax=Cherax quadricarinatus TaxID=27406 RepID=UPI00387E7A5D
MVRWSLVFVPMLVLLQAAEATSRVAHINQHISNTSPFDTTSPLLHITRHLPYNEIQSQEWTVPQPLPADPHVAPHQPLALHLRGNTSQVTEGRGQGTERIVTVLSSTSNRAKRFLKTFKLHGGKRRRNKGKKKKRRKQKGRKRKRTKQFNSGGSKRQRHQSEYSQSTALRTPTAKSRAPQPRTTISFHSITPPEVKKSELVKLLTGSNKHFLVQEVKSSTPPRLSRRDGSSEVFRLPRENSNHFLIPLEIVNSESLKWLQYNPDIRVSIHVVDGSGVGDQSSSPWDDQSSSTWNDQAPSTWDDQISSSDEHISGHQNYQQKNKTQGMVSGVNEDKSRKDTDVASTTTITTTTIATPTTTQTTISRLIRRNQQPTNEQQLFGAIGKRCTAKLHKRAMMQDYILSNRCLTGEDISTCIKKNPHNWGVDSQEKKYLILSQDVEEWDPVKTEWPRNQGSVQSQHLGEGTRAGVAWSQHHVKDMKPGTKRSHYHSKDSRLDGERSRHHGDYMRHSSRRQRKKKKRKLEKKKDQGEITKGKNRGKQIEDSNKWNETSINTRRDNSEEGRRQVGRKGKIRDEKKRKGKEGRARGEERQTGSTQDLVLGLAEALEQILSTDELQPDHTTHHSAAEVDPCTAWSTCRVEEVLQELANLKSLPSCPCLYPADLPYHHHLYDPTHHIYFRWVGVSGEKERIDVYHRGAHHCIRSRVTSASLASQTCCYDRERKLLTRGSGAGSPTLVSPEVNFALHWQVDILPWLACRGNFLRYQAVRPPNNGQTCAVNPDDHRYQQQVYMATDY